MRKTDKKIDNTLREALTEVCEQALLEIAGFSWLTHRVNYQAFPKSLKIICIFATNHDVASAIAAGQDQWLRLLIKHQLSGVDIALQDPLRQVSFDSEENCIAQHNGKWHVRLAGQ